MNSVDRDSVKRRILLVDDEDIVYVIKLVLQKAGFSIDGYSDPKEALANFRPCQYDLALLDIGMPGMGGFQLAKEIKKSDLDTIVCYLTALDVVDEQYQQVFAKKKPDYMIKNQAR